MSNVAAGCHPQKALSFASLPFDRFAETGLLNNPINFYL
jgi:hypothetical protein